MPKASAILLLLLLAVGMSSCKKEDSIKPIGGTYNHGPVSSNLREVFTIRDTAEYNGNYFINYLVLNGIPGDNSVYYDLDNNGINDLQFTNISSYDSTDGTHFSRSFVTDLTPDSSLLFVGGQAYMTNFNFRPFKKGDSVNNSLNWSNISGSDIQTLEYNLYQNYHHIHYWNNGLDRDYAFFKLRLNGEYKYGWIRISYDGSVIGPCVIER